MRLGKPHQLHIEADEPLIDVVKLLDQRLDAILVERERLDVGDDVFFQCFVLALLSRRERLVLELVLDVLILQTAQLLVGVGDPVEGFEHLWLEFGFHRGQRHSVFEIVVVVKPLGRRQFAVEAAGRRLGRSRRGAYDGAGNLYLRRLLAVWAGVSRLEVDDVAKQNLGFVEFVAPDDDGLEAQRALAQARDHRLAASFDALGDGDFTLAR